MTLAANGSFKLFNTMRGAVLDLLEARESIDVVALALAAYSRYLLGTDERGAPITVKDPLTPTLYPLAWQMYTCNASARKLVEAVLGYEVSARSRVGWEKTGPIEIQPAQDCLDAVLGESSDTGCHGEARQLLVAFGRIPISNDK